MEGLATILALWYTIRTSILINLGVFLGWSAPTPTDPPNFFTQELKLGGQDLDIRDKLYMLGKKKKENIIKKFATHEGDTGSPEVQIALSSAEIDELQKHLTTHKKDHSSRRGLLRKVSERRRLLKYLERESKARVETLRKALKL